MAKRKAKYYVVWHGKKPGIYDNWDQCQDQIKGFTGAKYKSFQSKQLAEKAYQGDFKEFIGQNIIDSPLSEAERTRIGKPIANSLAVDAAFDGDVMEYRGVHTGTGKLVFSMGPFESATNNIGEFLAIVHALGYLKKNASNIPIYSDSATAIQWVKRQMANTKLQRTPENLSLFHLIQRAEAWLRSNHYANKILKWETKAWGEIPADYGRK